MHHTSRSWRRLPIAAIALTAALAFGAPRGWAEPASSADQIDGLYNLARYVACAAGVASAVAKGGTLEVGIAFMFCGKLMAEEKS